MDEEEIREDREELADEATPETPEEEVEQRTDDYDALARRLDELMDMIRAGFENMGSRLDALGLADVEGSSYLEDGTDAADVAEDLADAVDMLVGLDALDLL